MVLAFAARCTSAFPFAFEPMTMQSAASLKPHAYQDVEQSWHKFLSYLPESEVKSKRHVGRAFGDGGYLDNKPFTYVAKTLSTRQATVPVERKLLYIEPAPDMLGEQSGAMPQEVPDALTNSIAALTGIPRYETIREDLQEVLARNRRIERIDRIMREGEADLDNVLRGNMNPLERILRASPDKRVPPWPEWKRETMAQFYGPAFLAYRRTRVSSTTDALAYGIAKSWGIDFTSDYLYALTALMRCWRDVHYGEDPKPEQKSLNTFLDTFDLAYRIRRSSFMLRQIDHLTRLLNRRKRCPLTPQEQRFLPDAEQRSIARLQRMGLDLTTPAFDPARLERAVDALKSLKEQLNGAQAKLRNLERFRGRRTEPRDADEDLRKKLTDILSLLLGEWQQRPITLRTRWHDSIRVRLPVEELKASANARTLQDSVMRRARALVAAAVAQEGKVGPTLLHEALERSIDALRIVRIKPSPWEILGEPELKLEPNHFCFKKKVVLKVRDVEAASLNNDEGRMLRCLLGEYYLYFDLFDQMSFPLIQDAGIGELATVEVVRISPPDASSLIDEIKDGRRKLAGTAYGNFGAFLDESWRRNDVMWGRLDGAERLVHTLLPMCDPNCEAIRKELIEHAHREILAEMLIGEGRNKAIGLVTHALSAQPDEGAQLLRTRTFLARTYPTKPKHEQHVRDMLAAFTGKDSITDYVRAAYDVDRRLEPKATIGNASRAVTIAGRMLEQMSEGHGKAPLAFRWVVRFGRLAQGMVGAVLSDSFRGRLAAGIMSLIYMFEVFLLALALLFATQWVPFAVKVIVATAAAHLATIVLADSFSGRKQRWLLRFVLLAGVAFFVVVGIAGFAEISAPLVGKLLSGVFSAISSLAGGVAAWVSYIGNVLAGIVGLILSVLGAGVR